MLLLYTMGLAIIMGGILIVVCVRGRRVPEIVGGLGAFFVTVVGVALICAGAVALIVEIGEDQAYQETLYERQVLIHRMENKELSGNEMLYTQIMDFNNKLRREKRWSANEWVGAMYNEKIATIDYIKIPGMQLDGGN